MPLEEKLHSYNAHSIKRVRVGSAELDRFGKMHARRVDVVVAAESVPDFSVPLMVQMIVRMVDQRFFHAKWSLVVVQLVTV